MPKETPDHHDAQLLIQVYDLRRESVMRESRQAVLREPTAFRNAEWVAKECPEGQPIYERIRGRVAQLAAARG